MKEPDNIVEMKQILEAALLTAGQPLSLDEMLKLFAGRMERTTLRMLLDEPETHLNPQWRAKFITSLRRIFHQRLPAGRSQDGVVLEALHFSRGPGRPLVLLLGQQHGDEPAPAEALLLVARALADGELAPLLEKIDVTVLPRANPDGAEWQRRVAADGLDINRDHLLLRTPEARGLAGLLRRQRPVVVVDAHEHTVVGRYLEKFNAVQRHDLLLQYAMTANLPESLGRASEDWFRQPIIAALAAEGLSSEWYYTNPTTAGDLRLFMGGVQPDTGRNVNGLRNAVSLLLESRGVGIGHLHLARRVHSQVVAVSTVLR